jgi:hypothetical protein
MFNPNLEALDLDSSWNQHSVCSREHFRLSTSHNYQTRTLGEDIGPVPISSIGGGIAPTLQPRENSTVNTRPPTALSQLQKWDRAEWENLARPSARLYTLDAIHMMSPAVSVELILV